MILMGIDPGSRKCGYGILEVSGNKILAAGSGIINVKTTLSKEDKLLFLGEKISEVIAEYKPTIAAVESIFYGKNMQVAFTLGHFRGVLVYILRSHDVPVFSYAPREIKQSVTGRGNATKQQVEYAVQALLRLKTPATEDAADGLACAICLFNRDYRK